MVADKFIPIEPDSEIGRFILLAVDQPMVTKIQGMKFRITRDLQEDIFAYYDPERTRKALDGLRGLLTNEQAEALKRQIRIDRGHDEDD